MIDVNNNEINISKITTAVCVPSSLKNIINLSRLLIELQ